MDWTLVSPSSSADQRPIAYPIPYGPGETFIKSFSGSGFGVVFEETDEAGFLYATDEHSENVLDALQLYRASDSSRPRLGDEVYIVWSQAIKKAGFFCGDKFLAVIEFQNRRACCRSGYPPRTGEWCTSPHNWDNQMTIGLTAGR